MTDSDLRRLLAVLDEVEPAPPDLVERVWSEVELVVTQERAVVGDENAGAEVVSIEHLAGPTMRPIPKRRVAVWLAVAAVLGMVVLSIAALSGGPAVTDDRRSLDAPSNPTEPPPATIQESCASFRLAIGDLTPFDDVGGGAAAAVIWVEALGSLIADIERVGDAGQLDRELLSLQLLRTALRTHELRLTDDDVAAATTALENARGHWDDLRDSGTELSSCLDPAG